MFYAGKGTSLSYRPLLKTGQLTTSTQCQPGYFSFRFITFLDAHISFAKVVLCIFFCWKWYCDLIFSFKENQHTLLRILVHFCLSCIKPCFCHLLSIYIIILIKAYVICHSKSCFLFPFIFMQGAVFDWEYADWELYRSYFHSYEMQHEYIEYFETLLRELKVCIAKSSKTSIPAIIRFLLWD